MVHDKDVFAGAFADESIDIERDAFGKAIDEIDREHAGRMQAARSAFDAVKANPEHPSHAEARAAFDAIRGTTPDYTEARAELDRAVRAADAAYHADLARIAREHGVTTV